MKNNYYTSIVMVERLHRLFLEVIKYELNRLKLKDITNVQALVLYNIGEEILSVGDLTSKGYYLGTNVSYNLRKMVENGYVIQKSTPHDRRASEVSLTDKGFEIYKILEGLFENHSNNLATNNVSENMIVNMVKTILEIEKYLNKIQN